MGSATVAGAALGLWLCQAPAVEDLLRELAAPEGVRRERALVALARDLAPTSVAEILEQAEAATPEAAARVRRALAGRADLLVGLVEALHRGGGVARARAEEILRAHYLLHRTPPPEDLANLHPLPQALHRFRAQGLSRREILDRLNRSGVLPLPVLAAPELSRPGSWLDEEGGIPHGAGGTVESLLAACGFPFTPIAARAAPGRLWVERDFLVAGPPGSEPGPPEALLVRLLADLGEEERSLRDAAAVHLACLPLESLTSLFAAMAGQGDGEAARLGDLGLAVRAARGAVVRGLGAAELGRWVQRAAHPEEARGGWFVAGARLAGALLEGEEAARFAGALGSLMEGEERGPTLAALAASPGQAARLLEFLQHHALGQDAAPAEAALWALVEAGPHPLPAPFLHALARRAAEAPMPRDAASHAARLLVGGLGQDQALEHFGNLPGVPAGPSSRLAAEVLASAGPSALERLQQHLLASAPEEERVPDWVEGLGHARRRGSAADLGWLERSFLHGPASARPVVAAALVTLWDPPLLGEGRWFLEGRNEPLLAALEPEVRRGRPLARRLFWASAYGRLLGIGGGSPGGRDALSRLLELLRSPSEELRLAGVAAARACAAFRREVAVDLLAALPRDEEAPRAAVHGLLAEQVLHTPSLPHPVLPPLLSEPPLR